MCLCGPNSGYYWVIRRLEYDPVGLILATIRVLGNDLVGRILAVKSAKRDFCNSRFRCVHCSALLPLNITKFLQKKCKMLKAPTVSVT